MRSLLAAFVVSIACLVPRPAAGLPGRSAPPAPLIISIFENEAENRGTNCRAAKIGSNLLLTAAHCIISEKSGNLRSSFIPGGNIRVWTAGYGEDALLPVRRTHIHPDYLANNPILDDDDLDQALRSRRADLAVIETGKAIPFDPEMGVDFSPPARGTPILAYSSPCPDLETHDVEAYKKASFISARVDAGGEGELLASDEHGICLGDSGGPVLRDDGDSLIVGVVSRQWKKYVWKYTWDDRILINHLAGPATRAWLEPILRRR